MWMAFSLDPNAAKTFIAAQPHSRQSLRGAHAQNKSVIGPSVACTKCHWRDADDGNRDGRAPKNSRTSAPSGATSL